MNDITIIIEGLKQAGATKAQVLTIMDAIMTNKVNAEDSKAMDDLLRENLSADSYISILNIKVFNGKIL
jgi:hypothetical protein|tara:strand:- start:537 stop:743 length:207 start_codon:yes stop_codon:yes gene_type:complete